MGSVFPVIPDMSAPMPAPNQLPAPSPLPLQDMNTAPPPVPQPSVDHQSMFKTILGMFRPYRMAMEMHDYVENLKLRKQQREQQAQMFQLKLDEAKRARQIEDFNTTLALAKAHAIPATPGAVRRDAAAREALGPPTAESFRPTVTAPGGQQYNLPSRKEEIAAETEGAAQRGRAAGIEKEAELNITDPYVTVPAGPLEGFGPTQAVRRSKVEAPGLAAERRAQALKNIEEAKKRQNPDLTDFSHTVDDKGDAHYAAYDPKTRKIVDLGIIKGAGKKTKEKTVKAGPSAGARTMLTRAQTLINKARTSDLPGDWEAAKAAVDEATAAYPDEIQGGPGAGGYPFVKFIPSAATSEGGGGDTDEETDVDQTPAPGYTPPKRDPFKHTVTKPTAQMTEPGEGGLEEPEGEADTEASMQNGVPTLSNQESSPGKTVPSSALAQLLQHPDVQARGITDIDSLRQDLEAHGYSVQ